MGDDIPRKGGPGITRSDLLVINKIDIADAVGSDLTRMAKDAAERRGGRPVRFCSLRTGDGVAEVVDTICRLGGAGSRPGRALAHRRGLCRGSLSFAKGGVA